MCARGYIDGPPNVIHGDRQNEENYQQHRQNCAQVPEDPGKLGNCLVRLDSGANSVFGGIIHVMNLTDFPASLFPKPKIDTTTGSILNNPAFIEEATNCYVHAL